MSPREVTRAFDELARVYDETREPPSPILVEKVATVLRSKGVRRVLEVGVGTARIALPLERHGLVVVGLDGSSGMLQRARTKGLRDLVRGDAYRMPFPAEAFDGALFVHVLHLLDAPARALEEACRVSRAGAFAIMEPFDAQHPDPRDDPGASPRKLVYEYLRHRGVVLPPGAGGPRLRERGILESLPPDQLVTVDDREVTEPLVRDLDLLASRASRWTLNVPPDLLAHAIEAARNQVGDRTVTYRRRRALAVWTRSSLAGGIARDGPRRSA